MRVQCELGRVINQYDMVDEGSRRNLTITVPAAWSVRHVGYDDLFDAGLQTSNDGLAMVVEGTFPTLSVFMSKILI